MSCSFCISISSFWILSSSRVRSFILRGTFLSGVEPAGVQLSPTLLARRLIAFRPSAAACQVWLPRAEERIGGRLGLVERAPPPPQHPARGTSREETRGVR